MSFRGCCVRVCNSKYSLTAVTHPSSGPQYVVCRQGLCDAGAVVDEGDAKALLESQVRRVTTHNSHVTRE